MVFSIILFVAIVVIIFVAYKVNKKRKEELAKINDELSILNRQIKHSKLVLEAHKLHLEAVENNYDKNLLLDAIRIFEEALRMNLKDCDLLLSCGTAYIHLSMATDDKKLYKTGIQKYEQALDLKPKSKDLYNKMIYCLIDVYSETGNKDVFEKCCEYCEKAIEIDPKDCELYINWGDILADYAYLTNDESYYNQISEKYRTAILLEEKKTENEASYRHKYSNKLSILLNSKFNKFLFDEYQQVMQEIVTLEPNDSVNYVDWGFELASYAEDISDNEMYKLSYAKFEEAARIDPSNNKCFLYWAIALLYQSAQNSDKNILEKSFEIIDKAISLDPTDTQLLKSWSIGLGYTITEYEYSILRKKSIAQFNRILSLDPTNSSAYKNKGNSMLKELIFNADKTANTREIEQTLLKAIELLDSEKNDTDSLKVIFCLLKLYAFVDDRSQFFEWLEKYMDVDDDKISNVLDDPLFDQIKRDPHFDKYLEIENKNRDKINSEREFLKKEIKVSEYIIAGLNFAEKGLKSKQTDFFQLAIEEYKKAASLNPQDIDILCYWGEALYLYGSATNNDLLFTQSYELYNKAIAIDPTQAKPYRYKAQILFQNALKHKKQENYNESYECYAKATELDPKDYISYIGWLDLMLQEGLVDKNSRLYQDIIDKFRAAVCSEIPCKEEFKDSASIYVFRLKYLLNDIEPNSIFLLNEYNQTMSRIAENDNSILTDWGHQLCQIGQATFDDELYRQGYSKFEEALKINPSDIVCLIYWAVNLLNQSAKNSNKNLFEQSHQKYKQAIKIDPNNIDVNRTWGIALTAVAIETKDVSLYEESIELCNKILMIDPNDSIAYSTKGIAMVDKMILDGDNSINWREIEDTLLRSIKITTNETDKERSIFFLLKLYAFVNERSDFFKWLEKSINLYGFESLNLNDSLFDSMKTDTRYEKLLEANG